MGVFIGCFGVLAALVAGGAFYVAHHNVKVLESKHDKESKQEYKANKKYRIIAAVVILIGIIFSLVGFLYGDVLDFSSSNSSSKHCSVCGKSYSSGGTSNMCDRCYKNYKYVADAAGY